jgi:hypothetical protein
MCNLRRAMIIADQNCRRCPKIRLTVLLDERQNNVPRQWSLEKTRASEHPMDLLKDHPSVPANSQLQER